MKCPICTETIRLYGTHLCNECWNIVSRMQTKKYTKTVMDKLVKQVMKDRIEAILESARTAKKLKGK